VSAAAIRIEGVWKAYPRYQAGPRTVRGLVSRRVPGLVSGGESRWALRDVSLAAEPGEQVGIIGANGAGKSTLLRLASGLGRPTSGAITLPARTSSVLSLGDAFDLTLTGRENALTAAIVAGLRRREALQRMDAILDFAELESFADAPMRTYSDGMRLRLAFGVIAQLEPQALLLDEVIAVGDVRFQAKCMDRIRELRGRGACVLFASHSLDQVAEVCDRVVWLQAGGVRAVGDAATVVGEYREAMRSDTLARTPPPQEEDDDGELELRRNRFGSQELRIASVIVTDSTGAVTEEVAIGGELTIALELEGEQAVEEPIVGVAVHRVADGVVCYDANSESEGVRLGGAVRGARVFVTIGRVDLLPGEYTIDVGVYKADWSYAYDYHWQAYPLRVVGRGGGQGVVRPPQRWRVEPRGTPET
jgi:lipopolysaccharide transport system ATP-binding protein